MARAVTFLAWAESLETSSYYDILRLERDATAEAVKDAFHRIALLCHPDRFVEEEAEVSAAAAEVFKRAAEAYDILRRPELRIRYDKLLSAGKLRLESRVDEPPAPKPPVQTLATLARTERGRALAQKADRLLSIGHLEAARVQLVSACQAEPMNDALEAKLQALYRHIASR